MLVVDNKKTQVELAMGDFALDHVPLEQRSTFYSLLTVLVGAFVSTFSFSTGAAIASGLNLSDTILATFVGGMVIQMGLMLLTGTIGVKTGLPTGYLSRWLGFGFYGSILPSVLIGLAVFGWLTFGIAILGHILVVMLNGAISESLAAIIVGIISILITNYGYKGLAIIANWGVPLFGITMVYGLWKCMTEVGGFAAAFAMTPPGTMSIGKGIMLATGLFVCGAVLNADVGRYGKNTRDLSISCIISAFAGLFIVVFTAAAMTLATGNSDPVYLVIHYTGAIGSLFLALITLTTIDYDLYLSVLYASNIYGLFKPREEAMAKRPMLNAVIGIIATLLAATGILDKFGSWLLAMAIFIPPIAGIIICHYFILTKGKINFTKIPGPVNWAGIISYFVGTYVNHITSQAEWGIPAINAIVVSLVLYWILASVSKVHLDTMETDSPLVETMP
jgi:cytosine permease